MTHFLKTQKGFYSPVADSVAIIKTQKEFYSLQLAVNAIRKGYGAIRKLSCILRGHWLSLAGGL